MKGQWIGTASRDGDGTNSGALILNVDYDRANEGWFQVDDSVAPFSAHAHFSKSDENVIGSLDRWVPQAYSAQTQVRIEEAEFPISGKFAGVVEDNSFHGTWETNLNTSGTFSLESRDCCAPKPPDYVFSWTQFQEWALDQYASNPKLIFRGHYYSDDPLMTTFHRTGRRSLTRYSQDDLPLLLRHMEATLGKRFDLSDPYQYGAMLNLAQHHGFPTPLQDWTDSPFIAAFFAFREKPSPRKPRLLNAAARIFVLDLNKWRSQGVVSIGDVRPVFELFRLGAADNSRVIPQQSVNMFSNLVDIEGYVEKQTNDPTVLRRIDIPISERTTVIRQLRLMGITSASLFPGLDGVCRYLSEECFE